MCREWNTTRRVLVTRRGTRGVPSESGGGVLLDLDAGFVVMFTWWLLRKLSPYDKCTFCTLCCT